MQITVTAGTDELNFNVEVDDFNRFINEQMPHDKVGPAHNFLSRTVDPKSREAFRALCVKDGKPNGLLVMQIAAVVTQEFGGDVEVAVKKPSATPKESKATATSN